MDGLEWKRSKWNFLTKKLMKFLEKNAVKKSQYIISDNKGIQQYYKQIYNKESFFVPYGADLPEKVDIIFLKKLNLEEGNYFILIARLEPENNIETILKAYTKSKRTERFLVIGNNQTKYARYLKNKFNTSNIEFCGSIYNKEMLDSLRFYAKAYLHGHSVGGTNPSLLEAMASSSFIIAHKNSFNISVLKKGGIYFDSAEELEKVFTTIDAYILKNKASFIESNLCEISKNYNWQLIIDEHEEIFKNILLKNKIHNYAE
jgi:glycosyltransferase involved in cell wall biosynthesis